MGCTLEYACPDCGYTAMVGGGKDIGMGCTRNTILCESCRELFDVVTSTRPWETTEDDWTPEHYACPNDEGHPVGLWFAPGPCPKCQATMIAQGEGMLWD